MWEAAEHTSILNGFKLLIDRANYLLKGYISNDKTNPGTKEALEAIYKATFSKEENELSKTIHWIF